MADSGYITVYQCRKCNTILGDSSSSINGMSSSSLSRLSSNVSIESSKCFCLKCKEFVATRSKDCIFQLEPSQCHSTLIGDTSQRIKKMEDQLNEQSMKISQLNARIIELGVQAITNRLDLITHKFAIEHNNPGFSIAQFKKDLDSH